MSLDVERATTKFNSDSSEWKSCCFEYPKSRQLKIGMTF